MNKKENKNNKDLSLNRFSPSCYLLDLNVFKLRKCTIKLEHNYYKCFFYHNKSDKRRNINLINYDLIKCNKNQCGQEHCLFAHNNIEILYHPNFYKKKICQQYFKNKSCTYGKYCSFAHSEKELQIKLIHKIKINSYSFFINFYKTEFCPLGNIKHNKSLCVYSHNFQDFKRNNLYLLIPKQCKNWDSKTCYRNYSQGCKKGLNCKYCHGRFEYNYHPQIYKKKKCKTSFDTCKFKIICHFNHPEIDIPWNYGENMMLTPKINKIY